MRLSLLNSSQAATICLSALMVSPVFANTDVDTGFQEAMSYFKSQGIASSTESIALNASSALGDLSPTVSGEGYYDNPDAMAVDAQNSVSDSESTGGYVQDTAISNLKAVKAYEGDIEQAKESSESIQAESGSMAAEVYCSDGSCVETDSTDNAEYASSLADLSALNEEASEYDKHQVHWADTPALFSGYAAHCRDEAIGALNCCKDSGWANGLFSCNTEEYKLGEAKEAGYRVVYVGRYCSHKVLGICTEHKKGYCVFPSRLAYDLQVYGGAGQLGKSFGGAESPNCYGLSVSQIKRIDLTKIDFSNIEEDITGSVDLPDGSETLENIKNAITTGVVGTGSYD